MLITATAKNPTVREEVGGDESDERRGAVNENVGNYERMDCRGVL